MVENKATKVPLNSNEMAQQCRSFGPQTKQEFCCAHKSWICLASETGHAETIEAKVTK